VDGRLESDCGYGRANIRSFWMAKGIKDKGTLICVFILAARVHNYGMNFLRCSCALFTLRASESAVGNSASKCLSSTDSEGNS